MSRTVTLQKSEQVGNEVAKTVHGLLPDADVVVNATARASQAESIFDRIRAVATRNNLNVHDVSVQDISGSIHVEQHVELDERMSLREGHDQVTRLEAEIRTDVPEIASILTHIESEPATIETSDGVFAAPAFESRVQGITHDFPKSSIAIWSSNGGWPALSCCTAMKDELPLSRVHDVQTAMKQNPKSAEVSAFVTRTATDNAESLRIDFASHAAVSGSRANGLREVDFRGVL
jgi:hypothetical protein